MKILVLVPAFVAGVLCASFLASALAAPGAAPQEQEVPDMAAMMEKAAKYMRPGEHHKILERFLGEWDVETRMFMAGKATPPSKGSMKASWLMEGRWLRSESTGSMMGMPMKGFLVMGYDNFKQSFVATMVNSLDTAMLRSEGDMDPGGEALVTYGTLDEYLTGEHDKMVKYVWRFEGDDKIVFEIHDLPIGLKNTKVIEQVLTRKS